MVTLTDPFATTLPDGIHQASQVALHCRRDELKDNRPMQCLPLNANGSPWEDHWAIEVADGEVVAILTKSEYLQSVKPKKTAGVKRGAGTDQADGSGV